jgi:predicted MFS family arabinose efflux permease
VTIANFAGMAGFGIFFPILPQYGLAIGADATHIGLSIAAFSLGQLLAGTVVGRMSDRYGRRRVLLWSLALTALLGGLTALCVTPWSLIVMRLFAGFAAASFGVTFAVASDVSAPRDRAGAMAQVGAGLSLGFILGPALGGLMAGPTAEAADFAHICYASAALCVLAWAATLWLLPESSPRPARAAEPPPASAREPVAATARGGGAMALLRDPVVARLMAVSMLAAAAAAMMESNFALFASERFAAGPRTIGFVFGAMGIVSTILQLAGAGWASRRFGDERVMQAGLLLQGAGLGMLAAATGFDLAVGGMMMISIGFAFLSPALSSLTSLAGPPAAQGEVLGLQQASGALGRVLGPGTSGPIYDGFGANAPFLAGAAAMFVTLAYARLTQARRVAALR